MDIGFASGWRQGHLVGSPYDPWNSPMKKAFQSSVGTKACPTASKALEPVGKAPRNFQSVETPKLCNGETFKKRVKNLNPKTASHGLNQPFPTIVACTQPGNAPEAWQKRLIIIMPVTTCHREAYGA